MPEDQNQQAHPDGNEVRQGHGLSEPGGLPDAKELARPLGRWLGPVAIDGLTRLSGGASKQTWSFDAVGPGRHQDRVDLAAGSAWQAWRTRRARSGSGGHQLGAQRRPAGTGDAVLLIRSWPWHRRHGDAPCRWRDDCAPHLAGRPVLVSPAGTGQRSWAGSPRGCTRCPRRLRFRSPIRSPGYGSNWTRSGGRARCSSWP